MAQAGFPIESILPHGSYLINLASSDPIVSAKSYKAFIEELVRCDQLGLRLYNFHPGSTAGLSTPAEALSNVAARINAAHEETRGSEVVCVLESVAGSGDSVGGTLEDLAYIISLVTDKTRVGVCLDTCHLFSRGYDITNAAQFEKFMQRFDDVIGAHYLKGMHINDSRFPLASRRDRHEHVGKGFMGLDAFEYIMNSPRFNQIPLILETPIDLRSDADEVAHLYGMVKS